VRKPKDIMPEEITAIKLRHNLGEVLDQVANKHARFLVKRSGIPAAVLMSLRDYEDLQDLLDTWHEQQDKAFQTSLVQARREIEEGEVTTIDDLRKDLEGKEGKRKKNR